MKQYLAWNNSDPNDFSTIEAESEIDALYALLSELGWSMGEGKEINEESEDKK